MDGQPVSSVASSHTLLAGNGQNGYVAADRNHGSAQKPSHPEPRYESQRPLPTTPSAQSRQVKTQPLTREASDKHPSPPNAGKESYPPPGAPPFPPLHTTSIVGSSPPPSQGFYLPPPGYETASSGYIVEHPAFLHAPNFVNYGGHGSWHPLENGLWTWLPAFPIHQHAGEEHGGFNAVVDWFEDNIFQHLSHNDWSIPQAKQILTSWATLATLLAGTQTTLLAYYKPVNESIGPPTTVFALSYCALFLEIYGALMAAITIIASISLQTPRANSNDKPTVQPALTINPSFGKYNVRGSATELAANVNRRRNSSVMVPAVTPSPTPSLSPRAAAMLDRLTFACGWIIPLGGLLELSSLVTFSIATTPPTSPAAAFGIAVAALICIAASITGAWSGLRNGTKRVEEAHRRMAIAAAENQQQGYYNRQRGVHGLKSGCAKHGPYSCPYNCVSCDSATPPSGEQRNNEETDKPYIIPAGVHYPAADTSHDEAIAHNQTYNASAPPFAPNRLNSSAKYQRLQDYDEADVEQYEHTMPDNERFNQGKNDYEHKCDYSYCCCHGIHSYHRYLHQPHTCRCHHRHQVLGHVHSQAKRNTAPDIEDNQDINGEESDAVNKSIEGALRKSASASAAS